VDAIPGAMRWQAFMVQATQWLYGTIIIFYVRL
jgi:hypothetical protein